MIISIIKYSDLNDIAYLADEVYIEILSDCNKICGVETHDRNTEFFDIVKYYIEKFPNNTKKNSIKAAIYTANILLDNLEFFTERCKQNIKKDLLHDFTHNNSYEFYVKISQIVGKNCMEELNEKILQVLVLNPISNSITQQLAIRGIETLVKIKKHDYN